MSDKFKIPEIKLLLVWTEERRFEIEKNRKKRKWKNDFPTLHPVTMEGEGGQGRRRQRQSRDYLLWAERVYWSSSLEDITNFPPHPTYPDYLY